jgi:hypothetical protein
MTIEALLERNAVAVEKLCELTEQLIAGRDAAIEQLKAAGAAEKPATRTSAKKNGEATKGKANETTATSRQIDTSDAGIAALVTPWMQSHTTDAERTGAAEAVQAMLQHFGSPMLTGVKSTLDETQRYQAYFFLELIIAGKAPNYSAEYDFDADPLPQVADPAPSAADALGLG